jgi:hypothetical protein
MGGTDDPSNIVELTIEEHVEAHWELYRKYGDEFDRIAAIGLEGLIDRKEIVKMKLQESGRRGGAIGGRVVKEKYPNQFKEMGAISGAKQGPKNASSGLLHKNNNTKLISMLDGRVTSLSQHTRYNKKNPDYIGTWVLL